MKNELPPRPIAAQRWLVVDDDAGIREFMTALLEMAGVEVVSCASADAALPVFAAAPERYQFIITDFEMPGMNGVEFCGRVLALVPGMKILLVTGQPAISEAEARRLGFCGLLPKPFPATALWQVLKEIAA